MARRRLMVGLGLALALVSLLGLAWWALADPPADGFVRLGTAGLMAAPIGFAAAAPTWRGSVRWLLLGAVVTALVLPVILAMWLEGRIFDGYSTIGVGRPTWLGTGEPFVEITRYWKADPSFVGAALAIRVGAMSAAAAAGFVAVRARQLPAALAGAVAVAPVLTLAAYDAHEGAEVAAALGIIAVAWLTWALLAARDARAAPPATG